MKLIFYDIDGTLIDQKTHRVPPSALRAMTLAHNRGCLNLINSGRTLCNLDPRLDGIPIDGWVLGCGTRVILHGESILSFAWSPEESLHIRDICLRNGLPVIYEGDEAIWLEAEYPPEYPQIQGMKVYAESRGIGKIVDSSCTDFSFTKLFAFTPDSRRIRALTEALGGRFEAIERKDTGTGWELVPSGYSKGSGIDAVCKKLGVSIEDCYVIGDSRNDLSMLLHVPNSIAMGNAEPEIRMLCSYVTSSVEANGIAQALSHFHLI